MQPNRLVASSLPHPRIKKIVEGCLEFEAEDRYSFEQVEEALSTVLNEIEINIQTKKELLDYLETFVIEDNQHIKKDLGSYYDKFLEQGVECQEDLGLVTREDLINMGLNKHSAKKTVRKFVEIAKITAKKRKEAEEVGSHECWVVGGWLFRSNGCVVEVKMEWASNVWFRLIVSLSGGGSGTFGQGGRRTPGQSRGRPGEGRTGRRLASCNKRPSQQESGQGSHQRQFQATTAATTRRS